MNRILNLSFSQRLHKIGIIHLLLVLMMSSCAFQSQECGPYYLHSHYRGSLSWHKKYIVLNSNQSLFFINEYLFDRYQKNTSQKLVFRSEGEGIVAFSCNSEVKIISNINPTVNTLSNDLEIKKGNNSELLNIDSQEYHIIFK